MNRKSAEILLAGVIVARSTSMIFSKMGLESIGVFSLLGMRFLLAFVLLSIVLRKRIMKADLATILKGSLLGASFFLVMVFELTGLKTTSTSTVALLENTAIILVPIFESVLRRRTPGQSVIVSALVALIGVALMTARGGNYAFTAGEFYSILAAICYAFAIILTDRLSRSSDPLALGIFQVGFLGLFSMIAAFAYETPRLPISSAEWSLILILAIVCTGFGFTLQPLAQKYTSSERAGLFCALNPAFASILGVVFLKERLGLLGAMGALLVVSSIFIPRLLNRRRLAPIVSVDA